MVLLWPKAGHADERGLTILNSGVAAAEDAPPVTTDFAFLPGDAVYVTFQVSGFQVKTNAETDLRRIALHYTVVMQDEANVPMTETTAGDIAEQLNAEDKNWIPKRRATLVVPTLVGAGRAHIHIALKDNLSGTETSADVPFRIGGERVEAADALTVENFRFLREEDSRQGLPIPAYRPGDIVFTSFDIAGFAVAEGNRYRVTYGISVEGPDGKPFVAAGPAAEVSDSSLYPARFLPERADVLTKPGSLHGPYTLVLTVHDLMRQQLYTLKRIFTLE